MKTLKIPEAQTEEKVESNKTYEVTFTDKDRDFITIYDQRKIEQSGNIFIRPAFCAVKILPKHKYEELMQMARGDIIETNMEYDEFFDKFYSKMI